MSEAKHTKGVWTSDKRSMTGAVYAGDEFIASVYPNAPEGWDGRSEYHRIDEMRANARLIAAAPELLGALREATLSLDGLAKGEGVFKPIEQTIVLAKAAIAKRRAGHDRYPSPLGGHQLSRPQSPAATRPHILAHRDGHLADQPRDRHRVCLDPYGA
ncbi:hypothetical protein HGP16_25320 [Rhizobium sp. P40RR-XXII]|uniref:hypothetical protein n=1 Tax=Rhizobium sp. P40RR-XXII TaxID=2726739 RepID=UPI0014576336|nr:hypothetical protein [Rhizobium sp. P40RR-XXII]NLS19863.1 hypothetical protein [Rhizobium sp. P40RR-XXII]